MHKVTLIPGDGTGPDVAYAMKQCVDATGVQIEWEEQHAGLDVMEATGTPLPEAVLDSIRRNKVAIKGPITTPVAKGMRSVNVALRRALDLYACLRPCKFYPGVKSRYPEADIVIVRENTEDLYAGIEFKMGTPECLKAIECIKDLSGIQIREDSGVSIKPISVMGSERIVRYAFNYAIQNGRKKVTAVHKANIMKFTDGLFLDTAKRVAAEEFGDSGIEFEERIVDNMCMQLVQKPELYDVLVLPNLYGDILSDLACGLVGGLGVAPGANIGEGCAVFEPTHGSAPKYKGQNKVNPTATILSGVMMLHYLDEHEAGDRLEAAVAKGIREGKDVTYDMKPDRDDPTAVGTKEMADAICAEL